MDTPSKRRWWRIRSSLSLRALMVVVLVIGAGLGWVARRERRQREAVAAIKKAGGWVTYSPDWNPPPVPPKPGRTFLIGGLPKNSPWPTWLLERFGPDLFHDVKAVCVPVTDRSAVAQLGRLDGLEELTLVGHGKKVDDDFAGLEGLTSLRYLDVSNTDLTGDGFVHLKGLTQLRRLILGGFVNADVDLVHLKGLVNLENFYFEHGSITDAGLVHLSGMVKIYRLDLSDSRVTSKGLHSLAGMAGLKSLELGRTKVNDLAPIKGLTDLRYLGLMDTPIDDRGLAPIAGFRSLEKLYLGETKLTDAGLAHVHGLAKLEVLDISRTAVTDVGLTGLVGLDSLKEVHSFPSPVTTRAKQSFMKSCPKVKVY